MYKSVANASNIEFIVIFFHIIRFIYFTITVLLILRGVIFVSYFICSFIYLL